MSEQKKIENPGLVWAIEQLRIQRTKPAEQQMFDEKIAFSSGMCIDCVLEIERRLSEMGEVILTCYTVTTVIRTRLDKLVIVTPQGKRHLRKIEAEKQQLTLDFFG